MFYVCGVSNECGSMCCVLKQGMRIEVSVCDEIEALTSKERISNPSDLGIVVPQPDGRRWSTSLEYAGELRAKVAVLTPVGSAEGVYRPMKSNEHDFAAGSPF